MNILSVNTGAVLIKPTTDEKSAGGLFLVHSEAERLIVGQVALVGRQQVHEGENTSMEMSVGQKVLFDKTNAWQIKDGTEVMYITYQTNVLAVVS
jgi:co-chaperonin GroES (HSP10)